MASNPLPQRMTETEYLAFERASDTKHEYIDGEIVAMSGASPRHNRIFGGAYVSLSNQLEGRPCIVYNSDQKVRTPTSRSYVYPDITVVCGDEQFDEIYQDTLLNPTLIIEILSPSTEAFDRGDEFFLYREIKSLQSHVIIVQERPHIEHHFRQSNGLWALDEAVGLDKTIDLPTIGCTLELSRVYAQVTF